MPPPIFTAFPELDEEQSRGAFLKGLELLNRPHSAISGFLAAGFRGEDPFTAAAQALIGQEQFSGKDVLEALGAEPGGKTARRAGLAFDILNPLDPLNFIGFGVATKAGRAAKFAGGLKKGLGAQARAGQRVLFRSPPGLPNVRGAPVLELIEGASTKVAGSEFGRNVQRLFGGREGAFKATVRDPEVQQALLADQAAERRVRLFEAQTEPLTRAINKNLTTRESAELTDILNRVDRGEDFVALTSRFIGGNKKRQTAVTAAEQLQRATFKFSESLKGTGLGALIKETPGFLPRVLVEGETPASTLGAVFEKTNLVGQSQNRFNRGLVASSTQPFSLENLTPEGLDEFLDVVKKGLPDQPKIKGNNWVDKLLIQDQENGTRQAADWFEARRMTISEQLKRFNALGSDAVLEQNVGKLMVGLQQQAIKNVRYDSLIQTLQKDGFAVLWDEAAHAGKANWFKIDQGRWAGEKALAIEKKFVDGLKRFEETFLPGPEKSLFGLGMLAWWKSFAITGFPFNIPAFLNRNMSSGVLKNRVEGLAPPLLSLEGTRLYGEAFKITAAVHRTFGPLDLIGELPNSRLTETWVTKQGIEITHRRVMQEYIRRGMNGSGSRFPEITEAVELFPEAEKKRLRALVGEDPQSVAFVKKSGRLRREQISQRGREKVFGGFQKFHEESEMLIRVPLMLKTIEDTIDARLLLGLPVPKRIGSFTETPDVVGDFWDVAMTNAREAIIRVHYDYNDLTPFERKMRKWIPFYTWMRKNIPQETLNMIKEPGKYMLFTRAYYNAFDQQGITPQDLPEWAQRSFAFPLSPSEDETVRWINFTSFMPWMDVVELANTLLTAVPIVGLEPTPGKTRQAEVLRYVAARFNPAVIQAVEQVTQRQIFSGRAFSGDVPRDILGLSAPADAVNAVFSLFPPARKADQLFGAELASFFGTKRGSRNEGNLAERIVRFGTGVNVQRSDRDEASLSENSRERRIAKAKRAAEAARREGDKSQEKFFNDVAKRLERGL